MADEKPGSSSPFHAIGAALVALFGGMATFADDCARVGVHAGGAADDVARVGVHVDDGANAVDDLARAGSVDGPAHGALRSEALIHGEGALDDAADAADGFAADLASFGLDAAEIGLDVYDVAAAVGVPREGGAPSGAPAPTRPRLVVAGLPNPPVDPPVDPVVLLVEDTEEARLKRLVEGCATDGQRCYVIACAPGNTGCRD
ncbi:MAG: hypothetical protein ACK4YP_20445, partial [Myxococcota bacterium]